VGLTGGESSTRRRWCRNADVKNAANMLVWYACPCARLVPGTGRLVVCRRPDDRYHGAQYRGRLNRIEPTETSGLEYFWHCCGDTDVNAEGCVKARHSSYDDA